MEQVLYACSILIPFGICLRMSLRLLYGVRGPQAGDLVYQVIHTASWVLTIMPTVVLVVSCTLWLSGFLLVITVFSGMEMILARRAMQRRSAWSLLANSSEKVSITPETLQNHQRRFSGVVGRSFRSLALAFEQGVNLPEAIAANPSALPLDAQAYAAIGAVGRATAEARPGLIGEKHECRMSDALQDAAGQQLYQRISYLLTVSLVMIGLVTFVAIKIIPSYQAIFADFGLELPSVTTYLIASFGIFLYPVSSALFGFIFFALICVLVFSALMYLADVSVLRPFTDRLFFTKHRALVLRILALAIERGHPLPTILGQLVGGMPRYPSRYTRRRLRRIAKLINSGQDWKDAMRRCSLIKSSDLPMLETAEQAGNLPWVLRMLAEQKVRTMVFRWSAFEKVAFPLLVIFIGMLVLFICVGLFLPLVDLIYGLA